MKGKKPNKRKGSGPNKTITRDPFFGNGNESKKKRRFNDDVVESDDTDEDVNGMMVDGDISDAEDGEGREEERDVWAEETADERRYRLAKKIVNEVGEKMRRERKEDEDDESEREGARQYENSGERHSFVANKLLQDQLEESGRLRRVIASRVQKPGDVEEFQTLVKHRQSVTAVCLSDDDLKGFSASKDGTIIQWDVESGKGGRYKWPNEEILKSHGFKDLGSRVTKHSRSVLALSASTDGRYLATGGMDRHVHLWDTRTREHIQSFPGHRGPVSCLCFRQGTSELFSGSFDRSIKIWNVEDRAYMNTLFGHQSEVMTIDCLRKERVLGVGRDRTMQLFKVPEESRLVFRASQSSLECGCFINNDEFISGSDDGNVELWSMQKKKPVFVVKNAHALLDDLKNVQQKQNGSIINGHIENRCYSLANSWVSSVAVCRGSDLAATGAGNGAVRLWALESDPKSIRPLYDLPLVGFVNSLAFAKSGEFLIAGVGKEPRLGRWGRISSAQNGVAIQRLKLS